MKLLIYDFDVKGNYSRINKIGDGNSMKDVNKIF